MADRGQGKRLSELMFTKAMADMERGDYKEALQGFLQAAEVGENTDAMYNLGAMYAMGRGTKQDLIKAAQWFKRAVDCGDEEAAKLLTKTSLDYINANIEARRNLLMNNESTTELACQGELDTYRTKLWNAIGLDIFTTGLGSLVKSSAKATVAAKNVLRSKALREVIETVGDAPIDVTTTFGDKIPERVGELFEKFDISGSEHWSYIKEAYSTIDFLITQLENEIIATYRKCDDP